MPWLYPLEILRRYRFWVKCVSLMPHRFWLHNKHCVHSFKGKRSIQSWQDAVVYFCFPTLGVAVPLRPGDFLIFNSLIPHCVSSWCKQTDDIYIVAMYLKSSVVGLNNNQLPLDDKQTVFSKRYWHIHPLKWNQTIVDVICLNDRRCSISLLWMSHSILSTWALGGDMVVPEFLWQGPIYGCANLPINNMVAHF